MSHSGKRLKVLLMKSYSESDELIPQELTAGCFKRDNIKNIAEE